MSRDRHLRPGVRWGLVAALLLVAAALRLHGLTRQEVWLDEANTIRIARLGPADMISALAVDTGAPLYYVSLKAGMTLCGDSEVAVRSLSVLFGTLMVPATGLLARRLASERAGWAAALLMASTPIAVQFSQEVRMYTLLPLLAALAMERLLAFLDTGGRRPLAAHAALLLAALYTHNWGLFLFPAAAAAVLVRRRSLWKAWLLAAGTAALLYLPWTPVLAAQMRSGSYAFIRSLAHPPAWQMPLHSLFLFASGVGTGGIETGSLIGPIGGTLAVACWGLLIVSAMVRTERREARIAVGLAATVPMVIAVALGGLGMQVYVIGRYEMLVLPLWLALLAASATVLLPGRLLAGVLAAWVLALGIGSCRFTGEVRRAGYSREMARMLAPRLQPDDRLVFTWLHRAGTEYYLRQAGRNNLCLSFPPDVARHQGWYDDTLYAPGEPALISAARSSCPRPGSRTWVVTATSLATNATLLGQLGACASLSYPFSNADLPLSAVVLASALPAPGGG